MLVHACVMAGVVPMAIRHALDLSFPVSLHIFELPVAFTQVMHLSTYSII